MEKALDELPTPDFAVGGLLSSPPPQVRVPGASLSWPLSPSDRAILRSLCSRSACGQGSHTVLDLRVRSAWELLPEQISVEGLEPALHEALERMAQALGEPRLVAELYKLQHYERGDHFQQHRDSVKQDGMIGTLILGLPGEHQGAELRVELRGEEHRLRLESTPERCAFIAFFADCLHELSPVLSGSRTCLVFSVRRADRSPAPRQRGPSDALSQALQRWSSDPSHPTQAVIPLAHVYPGKTPEPGELRGQDRALVEALLEASGQAGVRASLCSLWMLRTWDENGVVLWTLRCSREGEDPRTLSPETLLWPWMTLWIEASRSSSWSGNEGTSYRHIYQYTALLLERSPGDEPLPSGGLQHLHFELRTLLSLLQRAHDRRWRRLDLGSFWGSMPRLFFRGLLRLAPHLETLRIPAFSWLGCLDRFQNLHTLCLVGEFHFALECVPPSLLARLRALMLEGFRWCEDTIPAVLAAADGLEHLELVSTLCASLPASLAGAPLRIVRLPGSGIRELPEGLGQGGGLEELDVEACQYLQEIPPSVMTPALRELRLGGTNIGALELTGAPSLQRLCLERVPLQALPRGLEACPELEVLVLDEAGPDGQPLAVPDLSSLRSLRVLSLRRLAMDGLPALAEPSRLEVLRLDRSPLGSLPDVLGRMTNLRELEASRCLLKSLPDLSALRRLRRLDLSFNPLPSMNGLSGKAHLEVLWLTGCRRLGPLELTEPPRNLRSLRLDGVPMEQLPVWVRAPRELEELHLENTGLAAIPVEPGQWPALRRLRLAGNQIRDGRPLAHLVLLEMLDAGDNPLTHFPPLGSWPELQQLTLNNTELTSLHLQDGDGKRLWWLHLKGTPLRSLPRLELLPMLSSLELDPRQQQDPAWPQIRQALKARLGHDEDVSEPYPDNDWPHETPMDGDEAVEIPWQPGVVPFDDDPIEEDDAIPF
jgi:Leucine-rich repeat (LRR) protein/predicted 2-oxoglutarate/Fe(II)-dependent dioxygenase YbiX